MLALCPHSECFKLYKLKTQRARVLSGGDGERGWTLHHRKVFQGPGRSLSSSVWLWDLLHFNKEARGHISSHPFCWTTKLMAHFWFTSSRCPASRSSLGKFRKASVHHGPGWYCCLLWSSSFEKEVQTRKQPSPCWRSYAVPGPTAPLRCLGETAQVEVCWTVKSSSSSDEDGNGKEPSWDMFSCAGERATLSRIVLYNKHLNFNSWKCWWMERILESHLLFPCEPAWVSLQTQSPSHKVRLRAAWQVWGSLLQPWVPGGPPEGLFRPASHSTWAPAEQQAQPGFHTLLLWLWESSCLNRLVPLRQDIDSESDSVTGGATRQWYLKNSLTQAQTMSFALARPRLAHGAITSDGWYRCLCCQISENGKRFISVGKVKELGLLLSHSAQPRWELLGQGLMASLHSLLPQVSGAHF